MPDSVLAQVPSRIKDPHNKGAVAIKVGSFACPMDAREQIDKYGPALCDRVKRKFKWAKCSYGIYRCKEGDQEGEEAGIGVVCRELSSRSDVTPVMLRISRVKRGRK